MRKWGLLAVGLLVSLAPVVARAAENLRLSPHRDYTSDTQDGPLITGDRMEDGAVKGQPNYIIIYGED